MSGSALIGLGASMGDRRLALELSWALIRRRSDLGPPRASRILLTPPAGGVARQGFYNAVVRIETSAHPRALLDELLAIEARLGRRRGIRWCDRVVDLDLLQLDDLVVEEPGLRLPHPRIAERSFVLQPLLEVAPEAVDPRSGRAWASFPAGRPHPVVGVLASRGRMV